MKNIKKLLAVLLAGLMLLSLAACGGKDDNVEKRGILESENMISFSSKHDAHKAEENQSSSKENIRYNNLSAALLDLEGGKIDLIITDSCSADYIAARNEKVTAEKRDRTNYFSMMTTDSNTEVYDILNNAIKDMKADGTLDKLIENDLKAYIESDPEPKDLPHFDGAKTIKIGVTGDIPPMDFVASNGKAAGFNIALLAEIANRAQVNFELVQIETGARPLALSSGKVDAVFWTRSVKCNVCDEMIYEKVDGNLITESYFSNNTASLRLKSDK